VYFILHTIFFFYCSPPHRDLHSFPTRRSSDLVSRSSPAASRTASSSSSRRAHGRLLRCSSWQRRSSRSRPSRTSCTRPPARTSRSEEHTSELQSRSDLVCRLLLEKKKKIRQYN